MERPETGLLADNNIDNHLNEPETDILDADTELLNEKTEIKENVNKLELNIKILDEIILIHTDEVI